MEWTQIWTGVSLQKIIPLQVGHWKKQLLPWKFWQVNEQERKRGVNKSVVQVQTSMKMNC